MTTDRSSQPSTDRNDTQLSTGETSRTTASVTLEGRLRSGMGKGEQFVTLEGYDEQFENRLGYSPYPGTFNVELTDSSVERRSELAVTDEIAIDGWSDGSNTYGPAVCRPISLEANDRSYERAHLVLPDRTDHGRDQLEVLAPDRLRRALTVEDGDRIVLHARERE